MYKQVTEKKHTQGINLRGRSFSWYTGTIVPRNDSPSASAQSRASKAMDQVFPIPGSAESSTI